MKHIKRITKSKTTQQRYLFGLSEKDFTKENFIEGAIIRPSMLLAALVSFILGMFLLLIDNYKWGGSLIVFSFIINIYALFQSFGDEDSIYRTLNIGFKLVLFLSEIMAFNYVLINIL
ncbi:MAG: hypothetical protein HRU03_00660 [Nanoarchaeales archaeon]|nr:hypothetical protein [Nanoarchaeales archaeon]